MPRCGCGSQSTTVMDDGACIAVPGSGTVSSPYTPNLVLNPSPSNDAQCTPTGLLVDSTISVESSTCITFTGDGSSEDPLIPVPVIDPDEANLLACGDDGLGVFLFTATSTCVDLTGAGTVDDPLTVALVISDDPGNAMECRVDGVYAPLAALAGATFVGFSEGSGTFAGPSTPGASLVIPMTWDGCTETVGDVCFIANWVIIGTGGAGYYFVEVEVTSEPQDVFEAGTFVHEVISGVGASLPGADWTDTFVRGPVEGSLVWRTARVIELVDGDNLDSVALTINNPDAGITLPAWDASVVVSVTKILEP